jgi:hypothetical protein
LNPDDLASRINRLIELGYPREDIQVLADGNITIVPSDEMRSSAVTVARATAPVRIERMLVRKKEMDAELQKGESISVEKQEEYRKLIDEIERVKAILGI